ncbi:MAG: hypothetical protein IJV56_06565 [Neisseriaceae bacterium]|nr:hypothetical protein [Neisseriaceae bacterium]MBR1819921.1 hypothetical protein [Neisseriaceae bacterium]
MCDLSREILQPLSVMDKAKSIHRVHDATPLEIEFAQYEFAQYISSIQGNDGLLERLKDVKNELSDADSKARSIEVSLGELECDVDDMKKDKLKEQLSDIAYDAHSLAGNFTTVENVIDEVIKKIFQ